MTYFLTQEPYSNLIYFVCLFDWVLCHTDTLLITWRRSSFTGGGGPQVRSRALFQARTGT
jgi:hypothetical protein